MADRRDGHEFVPAALAAKAALAVVAAERRADMPNDAPLLIVPDVLAALRALAAAARARTHAKVIGVTGSVGKTSTKEALRLALSKDGETHASVASYNNHWGVPLSLARCPAGAHYAVLEMGMNHAGEIEPLSRLARPHVAIITTIAPVHLEFFGTLTKIADAKAEIFFGLEKDGAAVINRDIAQFAHLKRRAKEANVARVVSFGEHAKADARLIKCALHPDCSTVEADILGHELTYKIGAPGRHLVRQFAGRAGGAVLVGADLALAALALSEFQPASGRGTRLEIELPDGNRARHRRELQCQSGLDGGVARPARPDADRPARPAHSGARRHAGTRSARPRAASRPGRAGAGQFGRSRVLLRPVDESPVAGPSRRPPRRLCRGIGRALSRRSCPRSVPAMPSWSKVRSARAWGPSSRRCSGYPRARICRRLARRVTARCRPRPHKVDAMLYWLIDLSDKITVLNVFRYITFRTGGAVITALLFVFLFGPTIIGRLRSLQGKGQPIRTDGPKSHIIAKAGTPTMGGLMILSGMVVSTLLWANPRNPYVWVVLWVTLGFGMVGFYDDYLKVTKQTHKGFAGLARLAIEAGIALVACIAFVELGACRSPPRWCSRCSRNW